MNNLERKHYELLRKNFNILIKMILGTGYYTIASQVYDSDVEAFIDMKEKIYKLKCNLKMWRRIAIVMIVITIRLILLALL